MKLSLGELETISDPTPEQVSHYLQFMPAESPFIILESQENHFIQAIVEDGSYRVEYKDGRSQWFVKADYAKARELFWCFMDQACDISRADEWKKLTALNTPGHPAVVILLIILTIAGIVLGICVEFGFI